MVRLSLWKPGGLGRPAFHPLRPAPRVALVLRGEAWRDLERGFLAPPRGQGSTPLRGAAGAAPSGAGGIGFCAEWGAVTGWQSRLGASTCVLLARGQSGLGGSAGVRYRSSRRPRRRASRATARSRSLPPERPCQACSVFRGGRAQPIPPPACQCGPTPGSHCIDPVNPASWPARAPSSSCSTSRSCSALPSRAFCLPPGSADTFPSPARNGLRDRRGTHPG